MRRSTRFNRPGLSGSSRSAMLLGADGDGSTLSLDFTTGVLDSRLTFTRGTTATFINSQGLVQYANANIIRQSENCGSWSGAQNITPTADAAIAPNGTQTADQLNLLASSYRYQVTSTTYAVGQQYVGSIWMRTVSGTASVGFRIANSVTGANNAIATCSVTETWQRFTTPAFTLSDSANRVIDIGIDQRSIVSGPNVAANIYVWGLQLQPGTSADEYLPTTTTENLNVPRFDHDPTTMAPRGLLVEGTATNYMVESGTFSGYSNIGISAITAGSETDPTGTPNAALQIYATAGGTYHSIYKGTTAGTNTQITVSIWAKARTYTHLFLAEAVNGRSAVRFNLTTGATDNNYGAGYVSAKATPYKNGWWRCEMVVNVSASTSYSWSFVGAPSGATFDQFGAQYSGTGNATDGIYCYGFSVEAGSGASSYIPTGASQATRNVDICTMSNIAALNYNANGGTLFAHFSNNNENANFAGSIGFNNGANYAQRFRWGSGTLVGSYFQTNGTTTLGSNLNGSRTSFASAKAATSYSFDGTTTSTAMSINGAQASTTPTSSAVSGVSIATALALNSDNSSAATDYPSIAVRSVKFYPTALTMAQMNAITVTP